MRRGGPKGGGDRSGGRSRGGESVEFMALTLVRSVNMARKNQSSAATRPNLREGGGTPLRYFLAHSLELVWRGHPPASLQD